jgi:hypothetical protein
MFYGVAVTTFLMNLVSSDEIWRFISAFVLFFILYSPLVALFVYDCGTPAMCRRYTIGMVFPYWALMTLVFTLLVPLLRGDCSASSAETKALLHRCDRVTV